MYFHPLDASARRILVVLHDLPLGGTERIALRLASQWARSGRKVTILCGAREGALAWLVDEAVEVVECNPPIPRGRGSRRRLSQAVAAYLADRPHDVLFAPGNFHWPVMPAVARTPRDRRPAIIAQVSTPLFRAGRGPLRQLVYNWRTRRQFRGVDTAVTLSRSMTADLDRVLGREIAQCIRLPALDDESATRVRAPAQGNLILAAGRLAEVKGFDVALRAFAQLPDRSTRLVILGEGPCRASLTALAQTLGVADRIDLPGYVPDIRPWLDRARVFLLSSHYEGYAAVVIEALDAGRPVVSTDCTPAAVELLARPGAGAVAPIGDATALAACLTSVMAAPAPDPQALANLVARYRIGPISAAYLRLFDAAALARLVPSQTSAATDLLALAQRLRAAFSPAASSSRSA